MKIAQQQINLMSQEKIRKMYQTLEYADQNSPLVKKFNDNLQTMTKDEALVNAMEEKLKNMTNKCKHTNRHGVTRYIDGIPQTRVTCDDCKMILFDTEGREYE